jgi:D-3-phosphoglycerate dehydrogenase
MTTTNRRFKLVCAANLSDAPAAVDTLREVCDVVFVPADPAEIAKHIADADVLWVNFDCKVDKYLLDLASNLKAVGTATTGTDHLDKTEMARRGITLLCIARDQGLLKTFSATAECAWMLLLNCARNYRRAGEAALAGNWVQNPFIGRQLRGLTLGVLGVGRLGTMTVEFGRAFGMRVLVCEHNKVNTPGVEQVDFDTLLKESDALSIHIHMTAENRYLFNAKAFAKIKPGCILINTSRGDIIDETALLAALESGRLGGFGADVLHDEWRPDMHNHPVIAYARSHPNVVLTPHVGGATTYTIAGAREFTAKKIVQYLKTGAPLEWP